MFYTSAYIANIAYLSFGGSEARKVQSKLCNISRAVTDTEKLREARDDAPREAFQISEDQIKEMRLEIVVWASTT
jgi:hypothetical protein